MVIITCVLKVYANVCVVLLFSAGSCVDLELDNGEITFTYDFPPPFPRRPYGTVAAFSCRDGFVLTGSEVISCVNGTWNDTPPACELNSM